VVEYRTLGGRGDETFVRVPEARQREAVKFLLAHGFTTPHKLLNPKVVNQFKYSGSAAEIASQQKLLLTTLLSPSRLNRLFDAEVMGADKAYTVVELVDDLQGGLFSELKDADPKIDPLRRTLQRAYLDILKREFADAPGSAADFGRGRPLPLLGDDGGRVSELRAVARVALRKLEKQIAAAQPKAKDVATQAHLEDTLSQIHSILSESKK
jgi:hypothetical protein